MDFNPYSLGRENEFYSLKMATQNRILIPEVYKDI